MNKKLLRRKLALALANLKKKRKYYCELEYLESTGTQYIDTGYVPNQDTAIKTDAKFNNINTNNAIFQVDATSTGDKACGLTISGTGKLVYAFGNNYELLSDYDIDTYEHNFYIDKNSLYIDNVLIFTIREVSFSSISTLPLFAWKRNGNILFKTKSTVYNLKIWDNGTLVRDFIPVLDWNMTPCMYDRVTEQLFYNAGTGDFIAGREIHYVDYLESTGTQYINTGVKGKNNLHYKTKVNFTTLSTSSSNGIGGEYLANASAYIGMVRANGHYTYLFNNTAVETTTTIYANTDYEIDSVMNSGSQVLKVNGETISTGTLSGTFTSTRNIFLYAVCSTNDAADVYGSLKMYYCQIYDNDVLVRDYIPAISEDGTPFMFDRVSHTCFLNKGTGAFKYPAREVEYLTSDGNQYIDTGIQPTDDYGYKIRNTYTRGGGEQCAIGCMDAGNRFVGIYTSGAENQLSGAWGSFVGFLPNYPWTTGTILDVEVNYKNSRKMIVNGTELKDISDIHVSGTVSNTIYLFARHYGGTITKMKGNVYGVEITNGQNVVADFIPAFKDGQIGMYDKVSGVLKTNNGTGSFSVGRIVEPEYE